MTESLRLFEVRRQPNVQRAENRARRLWPKHKGFQTAYLNGWRARRAKQPAGACPYSRRLYSGHGGTWAFAWRSVWFQGWYEGAL